MFNNWVWTHEFSTTAQRALRVERVNPNVWRATIDGTNFGLPDYNWGSSVYGRRLDAGLESYDPNAVAPPITESPLHYEVVDSGVWPRWAGQDGQRVDPPLCGRWTSAYGWRYGQNATC